MNGIILSGAWSIGVVVINFIKEHQINALAIMAATFEHRLAACIASTGVFDFMSFRRPKNMVREEFFKEICDNFQDTNIELQKIMKTNTETKWALTHGMYVFDAKSPAEWMI